MTIAIDIRTGAVVGQVVETCSHSALESPPSGWITILNRDGYANVGRSTVRLEKVQ